MKPFIFIAGHVDPHEMGNYYPAVFINDKEIWRGFYPWGDSWRADDEAEGFLMDRLNSIFNGGLE